jgi:hypothetical protein
MRGPHPCCPGRSLVEELTQDESFYYLAISTTGTCLKRSRHLSYAHAFGFKSLAPQRSRNSERLSPNFLFRRTRVVHNMKASEYSMHMIMQLLCIFLAALSRQSKLSAIVSMSSRIFHNLWDLLLASRWRVELYRIHVHSRRSRMDAGPVATHTSLFAKSRYETCFVHYMHRQYLDHVDGDLTLWGTKVVEYMYMRDVYS